MNTKEGVCNASQLSVKRIILSIFFLLVLCRTAGAQDSQKATLTAADAGTCAATSTACLVIDIPSGSGGATFNIGANASANTIQFEASADYGVTWVALSVTPSSSTTTVTSTTSTGAWQANVAGYRKARIRCSTFVAGTIAAYINLSTASARSNGGGGSVTHTAGNLTAGNVVIGNGVADVKVDSACVTNGTGALSGCTSISAGSGASAAGATATGGFACVEAASTGWTPTAGQDYQRCDSATHTFVCSLNGAVEGSCAPAAPASVVLVPGTTAANTIAPTANGVVGLTVVGTTGSGTPHRFDVCPNLACGTPDLYVDGFGTTTSGGIIVANASIYSGNQLVLRHNANNYILDVNPTPTIGHTVSFADSGGVPELGICANVTPVTTAGGAVTTDQNMQACSLTSNTLNLVTRTIKIHAAGTYTTAAASSSAMTIEAKLCTVSGCGSGVVVDLCDITTAALGALTISANTWVLDCIATTQTAGASSVYERSGELKIDLAAANAAADTTYLDSNATAVTAPVIDNTGALFLQIAGAFSVANASNVFVGRMLTAELTQ